MSDSDSAEKTEKELKTEKEKAKIVFDKQRINFFKGTIAIIVIYGIFILAMSFIGILSDSGRAMFFDKGFAFTVTFISGTILVIIMLVIQIFTYKQPTPPAKFSGENLACPDYWILKKTPQSELDKISDTQIRALSSYYCENPRRSNDSTDIFTGGNLPTTPTLPQTELDNVVKTYNKTGPTGFGADFKMNCDRMYPDYMAYKDKDKFKDDPTKIRCQYLEQCSTSGKNLSWTSVCKN
jgi:hypothetical protein